MCLAENKCKHYQLGEAKDFAKLGHTFFNDNWY